MSDKTIRFIDSDYRELFQIPDGASITITYPPGDGRGTLTRPCQYIDEAHVRVGNSDYHVCEFAERMEALGAKYQPADQLRDMELTSFTPGEERFFTYNREEGNTCVGHLAGDFNYQGDRFHAHWQGRKNDRNTSEFQAELHSAVYALRYQYDFLRSHNSMMALCEACPEAKLPGRSDLEHYGFKLDTGHRQYFILCMAEASPHDSRFIIYAYDKAAPLREIQPGDARDHAMFYRNDAESGRCVGYLRGDFGRDGHSFYHQWFDQTKSENTPEFKDEFHEIMTLLRRDILSDLSSSVDYCHNHPEAKLPDRDGYDYGFKLETETRQYFVRCTTLRHEYFYVYAYNKAAPLHEQEKPSVLNQIREAQEKPRLPKDAGEHKHTRSMKEPER